MPDLWKAIRQRGPRKTTGADAPSTDAPNLGPTDTEDDADDANRDGAVWVADGRLCVRNPVGLGKWPVAHVPTDAGVDLLVNGDRRTGDVVLQAEDEIVVQPHVDEEPARIEIEFASDGMQAWATVHSARRISASLPDTPAAAWIELRGVQTVGTLPHRLTLTDVTEALKAAGVRVPPDAEGIRQCLLRPDSRVVVARAKPSVPGRSAQLWTIVHGTLSGPPVEGRDTTEAPRSWDEVEVGAPLVRLEPGVEPQPGSSVTGQPLPVPGVWNPRLIGGAGTLRSADRTTVIAGRSGHPTVEVGDQEVFAAIRTALRHTGDVAEADMDFDGDVWIEGQVAPERSVVGTGDVEVCGRVLRARVQADRTLRVHGGAMGAFLISGGGALTYARTLTLCERLSSALTDRDSMPLGRLVLHLHEEFDRSEARLDPEVQALADALAEWLPRGVEAERAGVEAPLTAVEALVPPAMACMRQALRYPAPCLVRWAEQTHVEASGDIRMDECLHCTLTTLGTLRIQGNFRGGSAWALHGATFGTLGVGPEIATWVHIGPQGDLVAAEVRPGTTVLRAGKVLRRFNEMTRNVRLTPDDPDEDDGGGKA